MLNLIPTLTIRLSYHLYHHPKHSPPNQAPNVATDKYNQPYNLEGPLISYIALVDPTTAQVSAGTFLLTRTSSGKGNQLHTESLSVDGRGNVVATFNAAHTIDGDNSTTVSGQHMGAEGMGVVVLSKDLRLRRAWVLFSARGGKSESEALGVSCCRSGWCAVVGQASGDMITNNEMKGSAPPSTGLSSGFLVLFNTAAIA